ncbi:hypothetical protein Br6_04960 [Rhodococcus sp. Br-6]|nr:hypothetical protein Br6_04960 [Rhodococcus sp. Br-6]
MTLRPVPPHLLAAAGIGGAAAVGATIGWVSMRVLYRMDRLAAPDGAGDPIWSLTWTNASFPFSTVAVVVVAFGLTFAGLAGALLASYEGRTRDLARQRRTVAATTRAPLLRRSAAQPVHRSHRGDPDR